MRGGIDHRSLRPVSPSLIVLGLSSDCSSVWVFEWRTVRASDQGMAIGDSVPRGAGKVKHRLSMISVHRSLSLFTVNGQATPRPVSEEVAQGSTVVSRSSSLAAVCAIDGQI